MYFLRIVPQAGEIEMKLAGTVHPPRICAVVSDVRWDIAAVDGHDGPTISWNCDGVIKILWGEHATGKTKANAAEEDDDLQCARFPYALASS